MPAVVIVVYSLTRLVWTVRDRAGRFQKRGRLSRGGI